MTRNDVDIRQNPDSSLTERAFPVKRPAILLSAAAMTMNRESGSQRCPRTIWRNSGAFRVLNLDVPRQAVRRNFLEVERQVKVQAVVMCRPRSAQCHGFMDSAIALTGREKRQNGHGYKGKERPANRTCPLQGGRVHAKTHGGSLLPKKVFLSEKR
jgi:hypothetical protein